MELSRRFEGKKFMWDGANYPDEATAKDAAGKYQADGFLTQIINEENQLFVFSRREIKEIAVEGKPA